MSSLPLGGVFIDFASNFPLLRSVFQIIIAPQPNILTRREGT